MQQLKSVMLLDTQKMTHQNAQLNKQTNLPSKPFTSVSAMITLQSNLHCSNFYLFLSKEFLEQS